MDLAALPIAQRARFAEALREKAYRAKRNRLAFYKPYPKQLEFHAAGSEYRERLFSAGNQLGKTLAGAAEMAMHLTGRYPDWWKGRVFDHPISAWTASVTGEVTRDAPQRLLIGEPGIASARGTGFIPADALGDTPPKQNIPKAIAMAVVKWGGGGDIQQKESVLTFKSYDQGREKFQGGTIHVMNFDEEPPIDIYSEGKTRTNVAQGLVYLTFTPLLGMSETVRRFLIDKEPGTHVTFMGIYDAAHYSKQQADEIIRGYPEHEREARAYGKPVLGSGAVFPIPESQIACDPFEIPGHWRRIVGMDLGWDHPTTAVWLAHDTENDVVYVTDVYGDRKKLPAVHASAIKGRCGWDMPVAWPHDGLQTQKDSGKPMRDAYRKEGLNMLPERAQFEDGSYGLEAGVQIMLNRMGKGAFKVFRHLEPWFAEYRTYHRKDGVIVAEHDDFMAATRYACMSLRFAQPFTAQVLSIYRQSWRA
jgi:phage terminase large subunit-like protein